MSFRDALSRLLHHLAAAVAVLVLLLASLGPWQREYDTPTAAALKGLAFVTLFGFAGYGAFHAFIR